jgi:hypothetical protein
VLETTLSRGLRTNGATVFTLAYLEDLRRRRGDGADDDLHRSLLVAVLSGHVPDDRDALLWMALLHTHEIHLRPGSWKTRPDVSVAAPVTERTAAAAVAALFPASDPRSGYVHWYFAYRALGYQVVSDIPPADLERVYALRERLSQDPRVTGVVPED